MTTAIRFRVTIFLGDNVAAGQPAAFSLEDNMNTKITDMRNFLDFHKSGLTDQEIANRLPHRGIDWVKETRRFMELPENFQLPSRLKDEIALQSELMESKNKREKMRKCLKCTTDFLSEHMGVRICRECKRGSSYSLGTQWVGASL